MVDRYYVDTSIWMDLLEDRKGYNGEPLGEFALKLFALIKAGENRLIISDLLLGELQSNYSTEEINGMVIPFKRKIEKIIASPEQVKEARIVAKARDVPPGDVLHAIIARDNRLILITRDKHFRQLEDISPHYRPEQLI